jgi:hypothetical protein
MPMQTIREALRTIGYKKKAIAKFRPEIRAVDGSRFERIVTT